MLTAYEIMPYICRRKRRKKKKDDIHSKYILVVALFTTPAVARNAARMFYLDFKNFP